MHDEKKKSTVHDPCTMNNMHDEKQGNSLGITCPIGLYFNLKMLKCENLYKLPITPKSSIKEAPTEISNESIKNAIFYRFARKFGRGPPPIDDLGVLKIS